MSTIKFACPSCGQHLACDDNARGMQIECPDCSQAVLVPNILVGIPLAQATAIAPLQSNQPATPAIDSQPNDGKPKISWSCEKCGADILAPYDQSGKSIECPHCHQVTKLATDTKPLKRSEAITSGGQLCLFAAGFYVLNALAYYTTGPFNMNVAVPIFLAVVYFVSGIWFDRRPNVKLVAVLFGIQCLGLAEAVLIVGINSIDSFGGAIVLFELTFWGLFLRLLLATIKLRKHPSAPGRIPTSERIQTIAPLSVLKEHTGTTEISSQPITTNSKLSRKTMKKMSGVALILLGLYLGYSIYLEYNRATFFNPLKEAFESTAVQSGNYAEANYWRNSRNAPSWFKMILLGVGAVGFIAIGTGVIRDAKK